MSESERYHEQIRKIDTVIVLKEMCRLRGIKIQKDIPREFRTAANILADNCRLLRISYQDMLSCNETGFTDVIKNITKANYELSPTLARISKKWNANWLQDYLKLLAPNLEICADAAISEIKTVEKILKLDKTLGKWRFRTIGKLISNGKELKVLLPRRTHYPNPFSPNGPLSETRYAKCINTLKKSFGKRGIETPFLADYLASYILDAPLYAYEAMLLKQAGAIPI